MSFTSNHDENSWQGTVFERMGDAHKVMAALTATFDGMPLIYGGQEEPMTKRLKFFERDAIGFKEYKYQDFYTSLMALKKSNKALANGQFGAQATKIIDDNDVLGFERSLDNNKVIGILNLSNKEKSVSLPDDLDQSRLKIQSEATVEIEGGQIKLSPWAFVIYAD